MRLNNPKFELAESLQKHSGRAMLALLRLVRPEKPFRTTVWLRGLGPMVHRGGHAIVIGASIGGLLAARAVAEHYDRVTILERDELPEAPEPRKGVKQASATTGFDTLSK